MIRLSFDVTEEQAEEIIESIDELDEGEEWEPDMEFSHQSAKKIRTRLHYSLEGRRR
jgi:hypothetical protein